MATIVLIVDTTLSMWNSLPAIRTQPVSKATRKAQEQKRVRVREARQSRRHRNCGTWQMLRHR